MDRRTELLELAVALAEAAEAGKVAEDMLIAAAGGLDAREGTNWQMFRWRLEKAAKALLMANPQNTVDQRRRTGEAVGEFVILATAAHRRTVPAGLDLQRPARRPFQPQSVRVQEDAPQAAFSPLPCGGPAAVEVVARQRRPQVLGVRADLVGAPRQQVGAGVDAGQR